MPVSILLALVGGIFLGRAMLDQPRWARRVVPGLLLVCGVVLFRQAVTTLGREALQAGELNTTGLAGIMLVLLALVSILTMRVIGLGGELGKAQRKFGRRK